MKTLEVEAAISLIKVLTNADALKVKRLVLNVLDYCHIEEFPEALIYEVAETLNRAASSASAEIAAPLSKLKQGDTEFNFAVNSVDSWADLEFERLKPKLKLYRRLIAW